MNGCPSEEQLAAYAAGACPPDEILAIEKHTRHCAGCRAWLARERQAFAWLEDVRRAADSSVLRRMSGADVVRPPAATQSRELSETPPAPPGPPEIPGCRILRKLSHGGQGIVYEAIQTSTKRKVAVKVLLPEAHASPRSRRRFEREIELVAQLRHPNIVAIFESGVLATGVQYYVMEYLEGLPLDRYVRAHRLDVLGTLELLGTVCDAVQHAHQHGVIHRDLKPTNILVDGDGRPRVVDFGLAKPLSAAAGTLLSVSQTVVGTLPYMSPEQAAGRTDEVDIRTDVYALGVILFELLTGRYPYPVEGPLPEVIRHITETPPASLSRTWSAANGAGDGRARRSRPPECPIDADLETIVHKALGKDRDRRYQSVGELGRDLRHYLTGEPIEARRDSTWYVLRKSLRRYRVATAVTAAFLVVLSAGLAVAIALWRQADAARRLAEAERTVTRVSFELTPPEDADLADHVQNLRQLDDLLTDEQASPARATILERIESEQLALLEDLEAALAANRLAPLVGLLVRDRRSPSFEDLLRTIGGRPEADDLVGRLCRRLERWIRVPPPVGRTEETQHCVQTLLALDPGNPRGREAATAIHRAIATMPLVYGEDFSAYAEGERPRGWWGKEGVERVEVRGPEKALLIASTPTTSGTARCRVSCCGRVVVARCSLRISLPEPGGAVSGDASLQLAGTSGAIGRCCVLCEATRPPKGQPGGSEPTPDGCGRIVPGRTHQLEIRYFQERDTYDALLDGRFLAEEAPAKHSGPVTEIWVGPTRGMKILVDDVILRASDQPIKQPVRGALPVVVVESLAMTSVGPLDVPAAGLVVHDFDGDGQRELVVGHSGQPGVLGFYRMQGPEYEPVLLGTQALPSDHTLIPCCMVGGRLAVFGVGRSAAAGRERTRACVLLEVANDFGTDVVFSKEYEDQGYGSVVPIDYGGRRRGFVIGLGDEHFAFELFEELPPGNRDAYVSLGYYRPHRPGSRRPSGIASVLPTDWDGDGDEDLFIGWGNWDGYCPAMVELDGVVPANVSGVEKPRGDARSARRVVAHPLTGRVGRTCLAASRLDTDAPHLIAASERRRTSEGYTRGEGLRVWRIGADLAADAPQAQFFEPCNAVGVAAGRLHGREVFASASLEPIGRSPGNNFTLRLHGGGGDGVEKLWEGMFFDVPWTLVRQLTFADVDGDGEQELLVCLGHGGLLVLSGGGN